MPRRSCDGDGLLAAFRAAVANLEAHVDEINALNVFPVPDGDTGSNMVATVKAALGEAEKVAGEPAGRVAHALSFGALMGARGNSGVICSQVFRGIAEAIGTKRRFNGLDLAHALSEGSKAAYGAVARPLEGTILTVVREASAAAVAAAERDNDVERVLTATVHAADQAVRRTPSLLPILREAGVVDSGGQGVYRLLQGTLLYLVGEAPAVAASARTSRAAALVAHADEGFGYETMFLLSARDGVPLDLDAIRADLEAIGESVLVAGDLRAVKVHVHNERPDQVIGYGLSLGALSRISVENLDNQARDLREARAAEFAGSASDGPAARSAVGAGAAPAPSTPLPLGVIAIAAGDGLSAIFRDLGVAAVVQGGASANPSVAEIKEAVDRVNAREILLVTNNRNIEGSARQVASMSDRTVAVVSTRNAAEGVAAILALDPTKDALTNAGLMMAAGCGLQTLAVTEAVRDATIAGRKVKKGQIIVLDPDEGLVAADSDRARAVMHAIGSLSPGFELITVYYGDGADLGEAETLARRIEETNPGVEVEVVHGGQPWYRYLIAAE